MSYLLDRHFIAIFLIVGFAMKLWTQRRTGEGEQHYYWMTVISTVILIAVDTIVVWAQEDPERRLIRLVFSVITYTVRPVAALSIALIVYPKERKPLYLQIPCLINFLVYSSAFYSSVAFSINEQYEMIRGPLGYTVHSVSATYILYAVLVTWDRFKNEDHGRERYILYVCAAACIIAAILDWNAEGDHVNAAIMVSSIFLYMFLRFYDANRDPLTKLMNRMAFYEDCDRYAVAVTAVVSADMNGLKDLNDEKGHEAGDAALQTIGKILKEVGGRRILPYRIGGDEFAILFIRQDETVVRDTLDQMKKKIGEAGYSVSVGHAMRGDRIDQVPDLLRQSDEKMYADKANYYQQNIHDRRKERTVNKKKDG